MDRIITNVKAVAGLIASSILKRVLKVGGVFHYELIRNGEVVWATHSHNTVTNEGLNFILGFLFGNTAKVTQWYIGLYTSYTGAAAALTGAMIGTTSLAEFTNYTGNRKSFSANIASYVASNSSNVAEFVIGQSGVIKGAFLASDDIGAAEQLLAIDPFVGGDRAVQANDVLRVTYNFSVVNV